MFGTPVENTWKYVFEAPVRTFFCVWCSDSLAVGKDPKVGVSTVFFFMLTCTFEN